MIPAKLLPLLQACVLLLAPLPSSAYPTAVFGTKLYGRPQRAYDIRLPTANYYRQSAYPLPEEYYYEPASYPVYYPRASKYEVYQAVLPYYEQPLVRSYYGYDDTLGAESPSLDIGENAQSIGQETYFEDEFPDDASSYTDYNDVNTAFMNNLIMSQLNAKNGNSMEYDNIRDDNNDEEVYGKIDEFQQPNLKNNYYNDDETVMELKHLAESKARKPNGDRLHWFQKGANKKNNDFLEDYKDKKRSIEGHDWFTDRADRKTTLKPSTTPPPMKIVQRGQKEEVLARPANPVKNPFATPVLSSLYKKDRQHEPSVYDTIKHMLDMEKSLEKGKIIKPAMRKRIISSEDSLTHQLSVLKKQNN